MNTFGPGLSPVVMNECRALSAWQSLNRHNCPLPVLNAYRREPSMVDTGSRYLHERAVQFLHAVPI